MRVKSTKASVELSIVDYQFPQLRPTTSRHPDWDLNWLLIRGAIDTGEESWGFEDPCLTTWDAKELLAWLRAVASQEGEGDVGESGDVLTFLEPNVGFQRGEWTRESVSISILLSHESAPAGVRELEDGEVGIHLSLSREELLAAAEEWEAECLRFPER